MTSLFLLSGGIGNQLFALPAIKSLSEKGPVYLYVEGDYATAELFSRCRYVTRTYGSGSNVPDVDSYFSGYWILPKFARKPVKLCGWKRGEKEYARPEWQQILVNAGFPGERIDVSDWMPHSGLPVRWDVGIVNGAKPGPEWTRKRYPRMNDVASALSCAGLRIAIFGQRVDFPEPMPGEDLRDRTTLVELADALRQCRVVVGSDSGALHLASSLGVPVVAVYTATNPTKGDPLGKAVKIAKGCERAPKGCQSTATWNACVDWTCRDILPSKIVRAAEGILEGNG